MGNTFAQRLTGPRFGPLLVGEENRRGVVAAATLKEKIRAYKNELKKTLDPERQGQLRGLIGRAKTVPVFLRKES